jgi:hypothetical protein
LRKKSFFFTLATDDELVRIKWELRENFRDSRHRLIEIQQQVIEYLNQVKRQSQVLEKLRKVKYLKDHFELKQKSDIEALLQGKNDLLFDL